MLKKSYLPRENIMMDQLSYKYCRVISSEYYNYLHCDKIQFFANCYIQILFVCEIDSFSIKVNIRNFNHIDIFFFNWIYRFNEKMMNVKLKEDFFKKFLFLSLRKNYNREEERKK